MLYQKDPTDHELSQFGLTRADYEEDMAEIEMSDDMIESWEVFLAMRTQWNYAPNGALIGLNYNSFQTVANLYNVSCAKTAFEDLRVMENQALLEANKH